jgi:ubiquinone/menaquinone biosynthesis C-methylase UbiE
LADLSGAGPARKPLSYVVRRYDRVARFYSVLEPLFGITPMARRKAVAALRLRQGSVVLEIGAGTGRNLPYLTDAVGPGGSILAVDAAPGMLARARRLIERRGWPNVRLLQQDAADLDIPGDRDIDAVLFSLSYSALPDPRPVLAQAWDLLRPDGRLVVMDLSLTQTRLRPLIAPLVPLLARLGPGDPYSRPWEDLADICGPVTTDQFLFGLYYVCAVHKPA